MATGKKGDAVSNEQTKANDEELRREAVKKGMGEPVFVDFTDAVQRARRNLMATAMIAIGFAWWGLELSTAPTLFGMQVQHLTNRVFGWGILWTLLYLEIHFVWLAIDALQEWRIRQSGAKSGGPQSGMTWGSQDLDYPIDPRQSSLYRWWLEQSRTVERIGDIAKECDLAIRELRATRLSLGVAAPPELTTIQGIEANLVALREQVKNTGDVITSARIPESLERFDRAFYRFLKSQNLRWILLDFSTPILLGLAGIVGAISILMASAHVERALAVPARPGAVATSAALH